MHEQVACHSQFVAGLLDANGEIVVVEESEPETFVEAADYFEHMPLYQ